MKCPNKDCGYTHQEVPDPLEKFSYKDDGQPFFESPVEMEQEDDRWNCDKNRKRLYACPKCGMAFIDVNNLCR